MSVTVTTFILNIYKKKLNMQSPTDFYIHVNQLKNELSRTAQVAANVATTMNKFIDFSRSNITDSNVLNKMRVALSNMTPVTLPVQQ